MKFQTLNEKIISEEIHFLWYTFSGEFCLLLSFKVPSYTFPQTDITGATMENYTPEIVIRKLRKVKGKFLWRKKLEGRIEQNLWLQTVKIYFRFMSERFIAWPICAEDILKMGKRHFIRFMKYTNAGCFSKLVLLH